MTRPEDPLTIADRNRAMFAHLTALVTLATGLYTGGLGAAAALALPLSLSLFWRRRAPYAAYHALQATVFQALGAIAYVLIALLGVAATALLWIIAAALSVVLAGWGLLPLALALTVLTGAALVGLPLLGLACALQGAYRAYQGRGFQYPLVGPLVRRAIGPLQLPA